MGLFSRKSSGDPAVGKPARVAEAGASEVPSGENRQPLAVPIYLDSRALLDLLASLEGGFTMVERLATQETQTQQRDETVSGEFGTGGALSNLVKIDVSGETGRQRTTGADRRVESERYHTHGSLLYRLREILDSQDAVRRLDGSDDSWDAIGPSDFVDLQGVMRPNPFAESVATMLRLIDLARLTADLGSPRDQPRGGGRQKGQRSQRNEMELVAKFLDGLRKDIEREDVNLFVAELEGAQERTMAVMALFTEYLRDPSLRELAYGDFKILGKVVRKLSDDDEEIELLRGTAIGGLGESVLEQLLGVFRELEAEGIQLPEVTTKVAGPALQVVPIAIYV